MTALPEDMIRDAAKAVGVQRMCGQDDDAVARAALDAGVPGLVQRLTEAEELLREIGPILDAADDPLNTAPTEERIEPVNDVFRRIDAFLSVGEGRSLEGSNEAAE